MSIIEKFLQYPLLSGDRLCNENGMSPQQVRDFFSELRDNPRIQAQINTWGPLNGYIIRLFKKVLRQFRHTESLAYGVTIHQDTLELHLGTNCQCACVFCMNRDQQKINSSCSTYPAQHKLPPLTADQLLSIVSLYVLRGCKSIYFSGGLEPFQSNTLLDVLSKIPAGIDIYLFTNGVSNQLDQESILKLVIEKCKLIRFSVHAATPETYRQVQTPNMQRGEAVFQKVVDHVKKAVAVRDSYIHEGKHSSKIGVTFLPVSLNYFEFDQAINLWSAIGIDQFDIGNDHLSTIRDNRLFQNITSNSYVINQTNVDKMKIRVSREKVKDILLPSPVCYAPYYKTVIDPYGEVWNCCIKAYPSFQQDLFRLGIARDAQQMAHLLEELRSKHPESEFRFCCPECSEYEYIVNACVHKLVQDIRLGIPLVDQPIAVV